MWVPGYGHRDAGDVGIREIWGPERGDVGGHGAQGTTWGAQVVTGTPRKGAWSGAAPPGGPGCRRRPRPVGGGRRRGEGGGGGAGPGAATGHGRTASHHGWWVSGPRPPGCGAAPGRAAAAPRPRRAALRRRDRRHRRLRYAGRGPAPGGKEGDRRAGIGERRDISHRGNLASRGLGEREGPGSGGSGIEGSGHNLHWGIRYRGGPGERGTPGTRGTVGTKGDPAPGDSVPGDAGEPGPGEGRGRSGCLTQAPAQPCGPGPRSARSPGSGSRPLPRADPHPAAAGPGPGAPEQRAAQTGQDRQGRTGRAGRGSRAASRSCGSGGREPRGHRLGQSPRSSWSCRVWLVMPDWRVTSPVKNKLPLCLLLRPR